MLAGLPFVAKAMVAAEQRVCESVKYAAIYGDRLWTATKDAVIDFHEQVLEAYWREVYERNKNDKHDLKMWFGPSTFAAIEQCARERAMIFG